MFQNTYAVTAAWMFAMLFGCQIANLQKAREAEKSGDLRAAAEYYGAVASSGSSDRVEITEARSFMRRFVDGVVRGKDEKSQQPANVEAALKSAGRLGDSISERVLWDLKAQQAEKNGDVGAAIAAVRKAFPAPADQRADEAVARILQRNAAYPEADKLLGELAGKYPASAPICIARAYLLGELRHYAQGIVEYDRCTGLDNQSMEQALYIGVQRAALRAYVRRSR